MAAFSWDRVAADLTRELEVRVEELPEPDRVPAFSMASFEFVAALSTGLRLALPSRGVKKRLSAQGRDDAGRGRLSRKPRFRLTYLTARSAEAPEGQQLGGECARRCRRLR